MEQSHDALTLAWLVRLRWAALLGAALLVTMLGAALHLAFPVARLALVGGVMAASNLALQLSRPADAERARRTLAGLLLLDGLLLSVALHATGGASNPLTASYLLLVVLAAATLGRRAGGIAVAASVAAIALLAVFHDPLRTDHDHAGHEHDHGGHDHAPPVHDPQDHGEHDHAPPAHGHQGHGPSEHAHGDHGHAHDAAGHGEDAHHAAPADGGDGAEHLKLHAQGTGLVFAVLAALVVYLVSWALRQREVQLEAARAAQQRHQRLADLGAFATSAAHELGSPLAAIAVAAKELERTLEQLGDPSDTVEDARVIRRQVDRCREVLDELARVARGEGGEEAVAIPMPELLAEARALAPEPDRVDIIVAPEAEAQSVLAPQRALLQVLRSLLANAQRAAPDSRVRLAAATEPGQARIDIEDDGEGMAPELLDIAGEQPLTSSQGLGVGLFVGRAILERLGGTMAISSTPGRGTRVSLSLPLSADEA